MKQAILRVGSLSPLFFKETIWSGSTTPILLITFSCTAKKEPINNKITKIKAGKIIIVEKL
ncbi:hypothetical protein [Lactobacillus crispatus]|uniref:hypothetical protein n=1 Tax=Lactobacillus crispatus TaxID=47770 RepID=UPI00336A9290